MSLPTPSPDEALIAASIWLENASSVLTQATTRCAGVVKPEVRLVLYELTDEIQELCQKVRLAAADVIKSEGTELFEDDNLSGVQQTD